MSSVQDVAAIPFLEVLAAAGISVGLALFVMIVLRMEAELPFLVSVLVVPVVVGSGFLLALAFRVLLAVTMLQAGGLLAGLLVLLVVVYEALKLFVSEPPPPTARY